MSEAEVLQLKRPRMWSVGEGKLGINNSNTACIVNVTGIWEQYLTSEGKKHYLATGYGSFWICMLCSMLV